MANQEKVFPLPGSGYPQLKEIIKAYFMCGEEKVSPQELNKYLLNKIILSDITRNSKFLVEIGIIEPQKSRRYQLTKIGSRLGKAIKDNDRIEISKTWRALIENHPFFRQILKSMEFIEHVEKSELKKHIVTASHTKSKERGFESGAVAILDILEEANFIEVKQRAIKIKYNHPESVFINLENIKAIEESGSVFDCSRLVRYCLEINDNYEKGNYASVGFLSRAIIDHIPPIFDKDTFAQVAAHAGERHTSFKKSCETLDNSLKNIVDRSIHKKMNSMDVPPFKEEINFSQDLNTVLARVVEELHTTWKKTKNV